MNYQTSPLFFLVLSILIISCSDRTKENWEEDFKFQKISERPSLEVCYTDSSRTGFLVTGEDYELTGQLTTPHLLLNESGEKLLWFEVEAPDGKKYSTIHSERNSLCTNKAIKRGISFEY